MNHQGGYVVLFRKALSIIGRENRGRFLLLIAVAVVSSGIEVFGAGLVYVLLGLVADPEGEPVLPLIGDVRQTIGVEHDTLLLGLTAVMAAFFVFRAAFHIAELYAQNRVAQNAGARLASKMVAGYLHMPYAFHLRRDSSTLIRNGHQATRGMIGQIFLPFVRITAETILVVAMLTLLVVLAPAATALAVAVIGGTVVVMLLVIQPRLKRLGKTAHRLERETLRSLQQAFSGIRDIKILGREHQFADRYRRSRKGLARVSYLKSTASDLPRTVMELSLLAFILLVFALSITFQDDGTGTLSVLGLFAYAGIRLQPSLQRIVAGLNHLKFATAPIDDVHADLKLIRESEKYQEDNPSPLPFARELRLDGVSFRYAETDRDAIKDIDLTVPPGSFIGICGPTGGGKTTLVDLMTGLLTPTAGRVTVDGKDLREHCRAWQRNLGVVSQMVFLTDESLRRNVALGVPKDEIDEEAISEAVELAQLSEFVDSLPGGLDTIVGERGVRVSGGQRQRVAIARALYHRPRVLIFDEGTSALDNATERALMIALTELRGEHTILMIAHRLSTVRSADRIVVIENARVSGIGTYAQLSESNRAFQRLVST